MAGFISRERADVTGRLNDRRVNLPSHLMDLSAGPLDRAITRVMLMKALRGKKKRERILLLNKK